MKTIAVLFVLSCVAFASSETVTRWGIVNGRVLGQETVVAEGAPSEHQIRAFAYPTISYKKDPIVGIRHIDHASRPVNLTFIDGGVYRKNVAILLKSQRGHGINSTFVFYGM